MAQAEIVQVREGIADGARDIEPQLRSPPSADDVRQNGASATTPVRRIAPARATTVFYALLLILLPLLLLLLLLLFPMPSRGATRRRRCCCWWCAAAAAVAALSQRLLRRVPVFQRVQKAQRLPLTQ